jgi:O-methyltransferase/methyltransferase family protein
MQQTAQATPQLFWDTITGFQRAAAVKTAIELDIFTQIGEGHLTAKNIAEAVGAAERGVRILCDSLTVMGFLTKSGSTYSLTDSSAAFLNKRSPTYVGSVVDFMMSPQQRRGFDDLTNAVKNGGSSITGEASMDPDSPMWVTFARAMMPMMFPTAQALAGNIGFPADKPIKVLDIAAGHGIYGIMAAQAYPNAQVYGADWANVLEVAKENAEKFGVTERYHTVPGSAFESDLGQGYDVILVPNFLHHFDKPTCIDFVKKLDAALAEGGKVITVEFVPNDDRVSPPTSAMFPLVMLAATPAGDAYTFAELKEIFAAAGLPNSEQISLDPIPQHLIISTR